MPVPPGKYINFFTTATGKYKEFVVPYVTSVLHHNRDAFVEILIDNTTGLNADVAFLNKTHRGEFLVRKLDDYDCKLIYRSGMSWSSHATAMRFVNIPKVRLDYTYIGDIDILVLQSNIRQLHANHMHKIGVPYSNIARRGKKRLTGLHCVKTGEYYKRLNNNAMLRYHRMFLGQTMLDEHLLYKMVFDNFKIPKSIMEGVGSRETVYRPYHGLHCSPQRKDWRVGEYKDSFIKFMESAYYKKVSVHYRKGYLERLTGVYNTLKRKP